MPDILQANELEPGSGGVYMRPADATGEFGYSDGEAAEQYLEEVFNAASDLSSRSAELQSAIKDWPSEYHLSSDRSKLFLNDAFRLFRINISN